MPSLFVLHCTDLSFAEEVCVVQAYARRVACDHDHTLIRTTPERQPLYTGIAKLTSNFYTAQQTAQQYARRGYTVTQRNARHCLGFTYPQLMYAPLGDPAAAPSQVVLCPPVGAGTMKARWQQLVDELVASGVTEIISICTGSGPQLRGARCLHRITAPQVFDILAGAQVVVGPCGDYMYVAALCNTARVVWGVDDTARRRLQSAWNPNAARVAILDGAVGDVDVPAVVAATTSELAVARATVPGGVVYVAVGSDYRIVAARSVVSLRRYFRGPVMVLTDEQDGVLTQLARECAVDVRVVAVDANTAHERSRLIKTQLTKYCHYDPCVFIDADSLVLGSIDGLWRAVIDADIAAASTGTFSTVINTARNRRMVDLEGVAQDWEATAAKSDSLDAFHFSTSTLVWRRTPRVLALFDAWLKEWQRFKLRDQPAFIRAYQQTKVPVALLDAVYMCWTPAARSLDGVIICSAGLDGKLRQNHARFFGAAAVRRWPQEQRPAYCNLTSPEKSTLVAHIDNFELRGRLLPYPGIYSYGGCDSALRLIRAYSPREISSVVELGATSCGTLAALARFVSPPGDLVGVSYHTDAARADAVTVLTQLRGAGYSARTCKADRAGVSLPHNIDLLHVLPGASELTGRELYELCCSHLPSGAFVLAYAVDVNDMVAQFFEEVRSRARYTITLPADDRRYSTRAAIGVAIV